MTYVDRQVAIYSFDGTRPIQTSRAARAYTVVDGLLREMFDQVSSTASGYSSLVVPSFVPHLRDVFQPEVSRFDIDRHLCDPMLHVRIAAFLLRFHVLDRVLARTFSRTEEGSGIVRDKTGLPFLFEILARVADQVGVRYEGPIEPHQVTHRGSHP